MDCDNADSNSSLDQQVAHHYQVLNSMEIDETSQASRTTEPILLSSFLAEEHGFATVNESLEEHASLMSRVSCSNVDMEAFQLADHASSPGREAKSDASNESVDENSFLEASSMSHHDFHIEPFELGDPTSSPAREVGFAGLNESIDEHALQCAERVDLDISETVDEGSSGEVTQEIDDSCLDTMQSDIQLLKCSVSQEASSLSCPEIHPVNDEMTALVEDHLLTVLYTDEHEISQHSSVKMVDNVDSDIDNTRDGSLHVMVQDHLELLIPNNVCNDIVTPNDRADKNSLYSSHCNAGPGEEVEHVHKKIKREDTSFASTAADTKLCSRNVSLEVEPNPDILIPDLGNETDVELNANVGVHLEICDQAIDMHSSILQNEVGRNLNPDMAGTAQSDRSSHSLSAEPGDMDDCGVDDEDSDNAQLIFSTPSKVETSAHALVFEPLSPISELADTSHSASSSESGRHQYATDFASMNISVCASSQESEAEVEADINLPNEVDSNAFSTAVYLNTVALHSHTSVSVSGSILDVMELYVDNGDSKSGLQRSINTICKLLPTPHLLPTSAYLMLKFICELAPPSPATVHYYCKNCLLYHGENNVDKCAVCQPDLGNSQDFNQFFSFDVGANFKYLFESRNLSSAMDSFASKTTTRDCYADIRDGTAYKRINEHRNQYDVTLVISTDGVRVRRKSERELWLIQCSIAEVPLRLRGSFVIVAGVWYDKTKPDMHTFMKPFTEQLSCLEENGIQWKHRVTGIVHTSIIRVLLVVADAPARAIVQNVLHFNGIHGCNLCEIETVRSRRIPGKKRVRYYPYVQNLPLRCQAVMIAQAREAQERGVMNVNGVKGPCILSVLQSLEIGTCFIPEFMHSVLLGVTRQMLTIWTSKPGPWSIRARIPDIDIFLSNLNHPDFIHRAVRLLKSLKYFKASDLYYFLLFESLPALRGHLGEVYLQHFILLVRGIYLLLQDEIKESDIEEADSLLKLFVSKFQNLYVDREMTHNLHQLCHLSACVRLYGPIHCTSAFIFEDVNGLVARATHGTNYVDKEIVNNIKISQGIQILSCIVNGRVDYNSGLKSDYEMLEKGVNLDIPPGESEIFGGNVPLFFSRARIKYTTYTSEMHKKYKSENFHVMWQVNGRKEYGCIKYFAQASGKTYICLRKYRVNNLNVFFNVETRKSVSHIIPVDLTEETVVVQVEEVLVSLVKVGKIDSYLYVRPNLYHHKL